jgi:hypothetical protein
MITVTMDPLRFIAIVIWVCVTTVAVYSSDSFVVTNAMVLVLGPWSGASRWSEKLSTCPGSRRTAWCSGRVNVMSNC